MSFDKSYMFAKFICYISKPVRNLGICFETYIVYFETSVSSDSRTFKNFIAYVLKYVFKVCFKTFIACFETSKSVSRIF